MNNDVQEQKVLKRKNKEQKELRKWKGLLTKKDTKYYFTILIIVLTIIYVVDEITSNINGTLQSAVLFDLFNITSKDVNSPEYKEAINLSTLLSYPTYAFLLLAPFYKALADKYGRRLFLAINTIGMGLGMLICMFASNIYTYTIGALLIFFVTPNDVQIMYIMEVAPPKHRAKLCSITKALALMSVSLIGVLRMIFMNEEMSSWRNVYIIPIIFALIVGFMSVFFVKETPIFMEQRIKYLEKTDEERKLDEEKAKKKTRNTEGGVINAIKFILKNKQLRFIALTALIFTMSTGITSYYETVMNGGKMTKDDIDVAIVFFPFANALVTMSSGFLADKFGRKKTGVTLAIGASIMLTGFVLSVKMGGSPALIGICYGLFLGCLWSTSDLLFLVLPGESTPTSMRASVIGTMNLLLTIGTGISWALLILGQTFFDMGWVCLVVCIPMMIIAIFILLFKVRETKNVNLEEVTGKE